MWKRTVCAKDCPDTCGLLAEVEDGRIITVKGDPDHPLTNGFICQKAGHFPEHAHSPKRPHTHTSAHSPWHRGSHGATPGSLTPRQPTSDPALRARRSRPRARVLGRESPRDRGSRTSLRPSVGAPAPRTPICGARPPYPAVGGIGTSSLRASRRAWTICPTWPPSGTSPLCWAPRCHGATKMAKAGPAPAAGSSFTSPRHNTSTGP